jgi:cold shock CspA family protein/ribosome-associated translation inhibitor RaiA
MAREQREAKALMRSWRRAEVHLTLPCGRAPARDRRYGVADGNASAGRLPGDGAYPESRARVLERIAHIEELYGRITAFRVVVKAPGAHHRTSGHYEVNIHVALPDGREIAVTRTATADERFLDLDFAIDDAFKRARRRLQDQVRRMRGQIKAHAAHPIGTVAKLWPEQGYGFVLGGDGREIYFHRNSVADDAFDRLAIGARVAYSEEEGADGPQASRLTLLGS